MEEKRQFLNLVQSNIEKYSYHVTIVSSTTEPRYAYTIGLKSVFGFELIFAGGVYYLKDDLFLIFDALFRELTRENNTINRKISVSTLGSFSLSTVDPSWSRLMMLGVFDYYRANRIEVLQIVPDSNHYTLDIPDMTKEFSVFLEPVWQWLINEWNYPVPKQSTVVTNIDALFGKTITEVMRWGIDEWEMFAGAGPDVSKEDMRVVSLGTILSIDRTLLPAIDLEIGKGFWREAADFSWNNWA